jgi:hypothetical protein
LIIFTALLVPWCVAVSQATQGLFLKVFLLYENLSRFTGNTNSGKHPHWWAYLPVLVYGAFPWTLFLPAAMIDAFKAIKDKFIGRTVDLKSADLDSASRDSSGRDSTGRDGAGRNSAGRNSVGRNSSGRNSDSGVMIFSAAYVLVTVVFFSLSRTQFDRYILPMWCPLVIMISLSIERWISSLDKSGDATPPSATPASATSADAASAESTSASTLKSAGAVAAELTAATAKTERIVSPVLAGLGVIGFIASVVAAFVVKDAQLWLRIAAPAGTLMLAVGWVQQYIAYRRMDLERSILGLALSTSIGFAVVTPVLFEYWYDKTYAGVHELVQSVADTDADVGQYKEFMPSLLYYRKGPVFFFYHLSQLMPRKDAAKRAELQPSQTAPVAESNGPRPASADPKDPRVFILVKKDFEPDLLAQPQLNLKLHSRSGEWSMYVTSDFVMDKPPTLEQSFNRLNWKDSMTDKFGFGPLTVPYSGGNKLWLR